jgi:hypothetical protein
MALFSELHGVNTLINDYKTILLITGDFIIAAYLPYLKQLIYKYNIYKTYT